MKTPLALSVALLLLAPAAHGAEDWTGFHLGAHLGQGRGESEVRGALGGQWSGEPQALRDHVTGVLATDLEPDGAVFGVQGGYRYAFDGGFVLGVELDYTRLGLEDDRRTGLQPTPTFPSLSYDARNAIDLDTQASLRAVAGFAFDRHLVYATGGWTRVDVEASAGLSSNGGYDKLGRESDTLDGSIYGIGYAYSFGNGWSLRAEYLRTDVDDLRYDTRYQPGSAFLTPAYTETIRQTVELDTLRIGVDYRF